MALSTISSTNTNPKENLFPRTRRDRFGSEGDNHNLLSRNNHILLTIMLLSFSLSLSYFII